MKQAAILAGGKGSRLSQVSGPIPKSLVLVNGQTVLDLALQNLTTQGVTDFVIFTGFESSQIEKYLGDGSKHSARIRYVVEASPMGSAGSLLKNLNLMDPEFLVVYGDTVFDVNLARMTEFYKKKAAGITLFLHPNDHPYDSDLVEIGADQKITAFHRTPHEPELFKRNLVNAALYIVQKKSLEGVSLGDSVDFARDLFPHLLKKGNSLFGYLSREYIKDMGTPDRHARVEKDLKSGKVAARRFDVACPAIFLDRDGTLTRSLDYVRTPDDLAVLEGVGEAIAKINRSQYLAVLATNQPVVARGEATESGLQLIHNKLETLLGQERAFLDAIYFCPHHPDRGFKGERVDLKIKCECRKPEIGMIKQAAAEYHIDLSKSWFVGDTTTDVQTALTANLKSVLVRTGYGGRDRKFHVKPDFEMGSLHDAIDFILEDYERIRQLLAPVLAHLNKGQPLVLAGPSRSGKSLVASTLRFLLLEKGLSTHTISLDHWLRPEEKRGPTVEERYDLDGVSRLVKNLEGSAVRLPYYDRHTRTIDPDGYPITIKRGENLIFDGTIALHVPELLKLDAIRVYVEAAVDIRRNRFENEYRLRGWDEARINSTFAARETEEIPHIERSRSRADFVLNVANNQIRNVTRSLK